VTDTHPGPALVAQTAAEAEGIVRSRGLRVTAARRLVIEALFAADAPVTAEEIAAGLDARLPRSDVGSVYRNLETLGSIGLVRHVHLGHGPGLYALAATIAAAYLTCEGCGERRPASMAELEPVTDAIRERFGYEAHLSHFPISGLCASCAREGGEASR